MSARKRQFLGTRGAAAVEFAMAGMFVLAMMFAVVEVGQVMTIQSALDRAVTVAARYAVVRGSASASPATLAQIKAQGDAAFTAVAGGGLGTATVAAVFDTTNDPGNYVTVTATLAWTPFGNRTGQLSLIPAMTLNAKTSLPILN